MNDLETLQAERTRLWNDHPVIAESAILPTRPLTDAVARVMKIASKQRASIAFWADPMTGKSCCITAIIREIALNHPNSGTLLFESVEDRQQAEGRLLTDIMMAICFAHKIARTLGEKREQVRRALIALSGPAKHLFIIIDEAQEVSNEEFAWLKAIINALARSGIKVTTVLFGQRELLHRKRDLKENGRSDLCDRFMKMLRQFHGLRTIVDLRVVCEALDSKSEFPLGSGWSYTHFLFPVAFDAGFRFLKYVPTIWEVFTQDIPTTMLDKGLPMEVAAAFFANLCNDLKLADASNLEVTTTTIRKALKGAMEGR